MLNQYPSTPIAIVLFICVIVGILTVCASLYLVFAIIRELNDRHKEREEKNKEEDASTKK